MSEYLLDRFDDFETLRVDAISLTPEQIHRAMQLSRQFQGQPQSEQQWNIYLTAFALISFEQWIHRRGSDLVINQEQCTIVQSMMNAAACNLQVNGFKLCLVATDSLPDEDIAFPSSVFDSPEMAAHFYVAIALFEEQGQATIRGFFRHDQLNHQSCVNDAYFIPATELNEDANQLVLALRCAEVSAIPLPAVPVRSVTNPLPPLRQILTQPMINVGRWVQQQLDDFAQDLSWIILPPIAELRSPMLSLPTASASTAEFQSIITQLERIGMQIPPEARGGYRDLSISTAALRLYAVTWRILAPNQTMPEWSLLLVLSAQPKSQLPSGIKLQVGDETQILLERTLERSQDNLFAQVVGTIEERFLVTIVLPNQTVTLPPFAFN